MLLSLELTDVQLTELLTAALEWNFQGSPHLAYRPLLDALLNPQPPEVTTMLGEVKWFALDVLPTNVLPCDGSTYLRADYPDLYSILPAFLIVDADTFKTPALEAAYPIGAQSEIGSTVGTNSLLLLNENTPDHRHFMLDGAPEVILWAQGGAQRSYSGATNRNSITATQTGGVDYDIGSNPIPIDNRPASVKLRPGLVAL